MRFPIIITATMFLMLPSLALANTLPEADAGEDQTIFRGESVVLNGTATDDDGDAITDWEWNIDTAPEGSAAYFNDRSHPRALFSPDLLGDYVLTLIAFDGTDISLPASVTISVVENLPPEAIATSDVSTGEAPLTVAFDGSASVDPEGSPLVFNWSFGYATDSSDLESPTHVFSLPGSYGIKFSVTDSFGQTDSDTLFIKVDRPGNKPPEANPTATPNNGTAPLTVEFLAGASDPDADDMYFAWDFGDPASVDNTSEMANPTHTYNSVGTYVAWLTVSDGTAEVSAPVTVVVAPEQTVSTISATVIRRWVLDTPKDSAMLWIDVRPPELHENDVISVIFDGNTLFAEPVGSFKQGRDPATYSLVTRNLLVRYNSNTERLFVSRRKTVLTNFDNSNGVSLEVRWGETTAVDQFSMSQLNSGVWRYKREIP